MARSFQKGAQIFVVVLLAAVSVFALVAGIVRTDRFESVRLNPRAISVVAAVDRALERVVPRGLFYNAEITGLKP